MTPFSKKFTKPYAKILLRIATGDLDTARVLARHKGGRPENTCYLVQQAVEKTLKAILCHCDLAVPLTRDMAALLAALPDNLTRPPNETALVGFTEFATVRRYEEGFYELTQDEINAAVLAADQTITWASGIIK